jgi:SpoVK/Ycf46/Vps4 family AAA+-type ATPase
VQVNWDDIGGLDKLKKQLQDIVDNIKLDPNEPQDVFSRAQPRGVLLYGPPGCSKTMLARAMATQGGLNFIHVRGTDIYSKYVGESEKAIARAFARARQAAPSILFIDEIDTVTASRDRGEMHGARSPRTHRFLLALLLLVECRTLHACMHAVCRCVLGNDAASVSVPPASTPLLHESSSRALKRTLYV